MAPTKPAKPASTKPSKKPDSSSRVMKSSKKDKPKAPPAEEVKSKGRLQPGQQKKPQKKQYSEEELDLPKLNSITPVGLVKPKGKKKGKVFVDDEEGMRTILAMVNAEKEGQIESKMMKARYLEEIREAKKKETEAKQEQKKSKFEQAKDSVRHKRKKGSDADNDAKQPSKTDSKAETNGSSSSSSSSKPKKRKSVAFA